MKTNDLIKDLAQKLDPAHDVHFYRTTLLVWLTGTLGLVGLFFFLIPFRGDVEHCLTSPSFNIEVLLSFSLFLVATYVAYHSSVPSLLNQWEQWAGAILLAMLVVVTITKISFQDLPSEFWGEMDLFRGRCGPILLILAALECTMGLALARRAAPVRPALTGAWVAVSAGALGLLATQLICDHENFLHLVVWHGLPFGLIVGAGILAGRKLLKW